MNTGKPGSSDTGKPEPKKPKKVGSHSQLAYIITLFALILLIFRNGVHSEQYIKLLEDLLLIGLPSPLIIHD